MTDSVLTLPVAEVLRRYRQRALSPVDVVSAAFAQIHRLNPTFNAFALIGDEEVLLQQAHASEQRWAKGQPQGELDGIPITIKDGTDVAGWPTREGSAVTSTQPVSKDSPLVGNLRAAGTLIIGKTTLPEYGHKGVTDSPAFGITRNPWNPAKTSGGSSGGAAVAAATGMGFLHQGTDGGGSIRIPASFCGVFGIKPTPGVIPVTSPDLFAVLASSGPLTRTVEDSALMLDVMAKTEATNWTTHPWYKRDFSAELPKISKGLRIAYTASINDIPVDAEIASCVAGAAKRMATFGVVEEISLKIPKLVDTFNKHWMAIAKWLVTQFPEKSQAKMDPYLLQWAAQGSKMELNSYLDANLERLMIIEQMKKLFSTYDVLVMPTMALTAFDAGHNVPQDTSNGPWLDWTPLTFLANIAGLPAASLPCGVTRAGMPVGIQIISGAMKDKLVLQTSHALEREIGFKNWLARDVEGLAEGRPVKSARAL